MLEVIAAGPGLVAVGHDQDENAVFWTSRDGTAWSRVEQQGGGFADAAAWSVAAGGPGLVVVGEDLSGKAAVWTSEDGTAWTRVPHHDALMGAEMHSVVATGAGLVAVGGSSGKVEDKPFAIVWNSVDGVNWVRVPHDEDAFGSAVMWDVAAGGPGLIAVGGDFQASLVWTSPDGVTWDRVHRETHEEPFLDDTFMYTVAATDELIVAGGDDMSLEGANMWTSPDGLNWSLLPVEAWEDFAGYAVEAILPSDHGWVAVGRYAGAAWTSPDGMTWTRTADYSTFGYTWFTSACVFGDEIIAVGSSAEAEGATVWRFSP